MTPSVRDIEGMEGTQVRRLREGALGGLSFLRSIEFPPELQQIEAGAFPETTSLSVVNLSATSLTTLETDALRGLLRLEEVLLPAGLTRIKARAFPNTTAMNRLDLSHTQLTVLEAGAMRGLSSLGLATATPGTGRECDGCLKLPPTLATIEPVAFPTFAEGIVDLELSHTRVQELLPGAFDGLTGLVEVVFPVGLQHLRGGALRQSTRIKPLNLSETGVATLEPHALQGQSATDALYPRGLKHIEPGAFIGCRSFETVSLASTQVQWLRAGALEGLETIVDLKLPDSLRRIEQGVFRGMGDLHVSDSYPADWSATNVTRLETGALDGLKGMRNVRLPRVLSHIEPGAFRNATSLVNIDLEETMLEVLVAGAMEGLESVINAPFPPSLRIIEAGGLKGLFKVNESESYALKLSETAVEVLVTGATDGMSMVSKVSLPSGLLEIQGGAFREAVNVGTIDLEQTSLTMLHPEALDGMPSLTMLTLPSTLRTLGRGCFGQSSAAVLTLRDTQVTTLPTGVFDGMQRLQTLLLPDGLKVIEEDAFRNGQFLEDLDLGQTRVKRLVEGALRGLTSLE